MAKRKKKERVETHAVEAASHNPFAAALSGLSGPEADLPVDEPAAVEPTTLSSVRTRRERKGRGGKTVTLVWGLDRLTPDELQQTAKKLRKALGTGTAIEGDEIVVQGDVGERVEAWFAAQKGDE